ncbi:MAG TPA: type I-C CRISPR-associated protein Cas5c [Magnetospirillum sp.]|nr:type I-C CRISPR-associated protein Cas5c [Magnetospirillum sp.]
MAFGVRLHVWGERACFTRPEMKVERVSYDVITPSAARGILEAIHWKPAIRWVVDRITVLKPVRFEPVRRQSHGDDGPRPPQHVSLILRDVSYVIEAHFVLTSRASPEDTAAKHLEMFTRRASKGRCFHPPSLGCRSFPAHFRLLGKDEVIHPDPALAGERDLGYVLHDIDFDHGRVPHFFHAVMTDGVIAVPPFQQGGPLA